MDPIITTVPGGNSFPSPVADRVLFDEENRRLFVATAEGWRPAGWERAAECLRRKAPERFREPEPGSELVFVSDDGSRADLRTLGPLARDGVPFTLSLVRDFLTGVSRTDQMSPAEVDQMVSWGCEVSGHGLTHRPLASMEPARMRDEIEGSVAALRGFGWPVSTFVFPFGSYNLLGRRILAENGLAGCLTHGGISRGRIDPTSIPRVAFGSFQRPRQDALPFYLRLVEDAHSAGKLLVFMLHPEEPRHDRVQQEALLRTIERARHLGMAITTLGEAVEARRPLWQEAPQPVRQLSLLRNGAFEYLWTGGSRNKAACSWLTRDSAFGPLVWKARGKLRRMLGKTLGRKGKYDP